MASPRALTFGADGNLYVAGYSSGAVYKFQGGTGTFLGVFCNDTRINRPAGIAFGPDGNLYLACVNTAQVLRFNGTTGAFIDVFASDGLVFPNDISFGPVFTVHPSSFSISPGIILSGGLNELQYNDGQRLIARPGVVLSSNQTPLQIVIEGSSPVHTPTKLRVLVEAQVSQANISQTISLFDFVSSSWEVLDTRAGTISDSVADVAASGNPEGYVQTNGTIRARVGYRATGPILSYPWQARVDRVLWSVVP